MTTKQTVRNDLNMFDLMINAFVVMSFFPYFILGAGKK